MLTIETLLNQNSQLIEDLIKSYEHELKRCQKNIEFYQRRINELKTIKIYVEHIVER